MFVHLPLLVTQLELYHLPRGPERFGAYLKLLMAGRHARLVPLNDAYERFNKGSETEAGSSSIAS